MTDNTNYMPERIDLAGTSPRDERIAQLRQLYPEVFTDGKIDFDALRLSLGDEVETAPREERFGLRWPGKSKLQQIINQPSVGTLVPQPEESVDWDTTQNLIIEGDNLEVLKLLQKSYAGKVKMIYIDPPYNTGNDFVYPDNYAEGLESYLEWTGQVTEFGKPIESNTETEGRYHTNWLNMMYPRLKLARNLLREDGLLFVSIDDNEINNLCKVCDELFGESNFIASCTVISNPRGRQSDTFLANVNDFLVVYAKDTEVAVINGMPLSNEQRSEFSLSEANGEHYRLLGLRQRGSASNREDRPEMFFPIFVDPVSKDISLDEVEGWESVYPKKSDGRDGRWMWSREKCRRDKNLLVARLIARRNEHDLFVKDYLNRGNGERTKKFRSLWDRSGYNNQVGTQEVKGLLGADVMSFPKPRPLIEDVCRMGSQSPDLVLDFFAGSGTTAHAVMNLVWTESEAEEVLRRYILVQLPEPLEERRTLDDGTELKTIADITRERVRRAGREIREEHAEAIAKRKTPIDTGFRAYKLAPSNFQPWNGDIANGDIAQQLDLMADHTNPEATDEALLAELLLKIGLELTCAVSTETIAGKKVFNIEDGAVLASFDRAISLDLIEAMAARQPTEIICLDAGFPDDQTKVNAGQIVASHARHAETSIAFKVI